MHVNDVYPPGEHAAFAVDISSSASVDQLLKDVSAQFSAAPTVAVNSAGITRDGLALKMSEAKYDQVMDINLKVRPGLGHQPKSMTVSWAST